jgi:hypothetical protein
MSNTNAAGYGGDIRGSIYAPDRISAKVVMQYQQCALLPNIAKSDFISTEELMCGGKVIYGIEQPFNMFASDRQNNEHPEVSVGPGLDTGSMTICQSRKFEIKVSNRDYKLMCNNAETWENMVKRNLQRSINELVDAYSIPKIMASASPNNVGNAAGKLSHSIDLGWQDNTALNANSVAGFEELLYSFDQLVTESGMTCATGDAEGEGAVGKPVIVVPIQLKKYALQLMKSLNTCCSEKNALVTGAVGPMLGFDVFFSTKLVAHQYGAAGNIAPILLVDPSQVLHAFDTINTQWYPGKFEKSLVGEFLFDTHVVQPEAVAVAFSKV